jgi:hypothetical protein
MTDQRGSDRHQEPVDAREAAADRREELADARDAVADRREEIADARDAAADRREELADVRDATADRREELADRREHGLDALARAIGVSHPPPQERIAQALLRSQEALHRSHATIARAIAALEASSIRWQGEQALVDREVSASHFCVREPRKGNGNTSS